MNEQVINDLLSQLEESLKNVEAARKQVEKTVSAYEALKDDVMHYTQELSIIVDNTRTMIEQLTEIKEKFLANISVSIINEIKSAVKLLSDKTEQISSQISSLNELIGTKSESIMDEIKNLADSFETSLQQIHECNMDIQSKIDTLSGNEDKHFKEITKRLEQQENNVLLELRKVHKQNIILSIVNIILLLIIIVLLFFRG